VLSGEIAAAVAPDLDTRIAELADVGTKFWMQGDKESAERTFADALSLNAPLPAKRELLLRMVQLYENAGDPLRAIAVMEKYLRDVPDDRDHPQLLIRLGLLYRETGAFSAATGRFYQVLNSTLRLAAEDVGANRRIATKARLEIADTYMMQGILDEAQKFYSLLQLLDLEAPDRERVQFRGGQLQHARKLWLPAERELAAFLQAFPESSFAAEARYLRAKALKELGRKDEAVQEVVALLRGQEHATDPALAKTVAYWKRRTGNELANTFYEQGDILGALSIYQALARASEEPSWRWPAVYQVGLCFERLHLPQRAAEAYKVIVAPDPAPPADAPLSETLVSLQGMAQWRLDHLDWIEQFENKLQELTAGKPADA
jgi:tetratricopeptide (TPR) repeat protein